LIVHTDGQTRLMMFLVAVVLPLGVRTLKLAGSASAA
jgi:hypothetical protein